MILHFQRTLLLFITIYAFEAHAQTINDLSPQKMLNEISVKGPKRVVREYADNQQLWDVFLQYIESGKAEWLRVAFNLKPGTDAGTSEDLNFSVARALPKNPRGVLKLIGKRFSFEEVCTSPFIEPEPGVAEKYEKEAQNALSQVGSGLLAKRARKCLKRIRKSVS
jgi:hypothetical protein